MQTDRRRPSRSGPGLGLAAILALVVCCLGPTLLAGAGLAAFGGLLRNPLIIGVGLMLIAGVVVVAARRARRGEDACCPRERTDDAAGNGQ